MAISQTYKKNSLTRSCGLFERLDDGLQNYDDAIHSTLTRERVLFIQLAASN